MPTLVIQLLHLPPVEHVLKADAITIGRMKGNTIALDDVSVSLSHAKLTRQGDDYILKDLNSTNGTLLNGQSITEARLRDGDHVKFGEVTGRYYAGEAVAPNPPAVPAKPAAALSPAASEPAGAGSKQPPQAPVPSVKFKKFPVLTAVFAGIAGGALVVWLIWRFALSGQPGAAISPAPESAALSQPPTAAAPAVGSSANQDLASLVQALKSKDAGERRRAAALLNAMGTGAKNAVPALREAISDANPEVRMWAALGLIKNNIYDTAAIPILIPLLQHEDPVMRQVACLSLALTPCGEKERETIITALTESADKDANTEVRNAAVSALKIIVSAAPPVGR